MKSKRFAWLAAALAVVAAGSWWCLREAPAGISHLREDDSATVHDGSGREPVTSRTRRESVSFRASAPEGESASQLGLPDRSERREVAAGGSRVTPEPSRIPGAGRPNNKQGAQRAGGSADAGPAADTRADESGVSTPLPAGLRLAPDVRLPAAALPVDFKMSPVAEKALKNIVDDYYRDLAAAMTPELDAANHGGDGGVIETGENGEKTVVVTNGKVADDARKRADARFKALFGNAAFNRMTIQSALESRLPADVRR